MKISFNIPVCREIQPRNAKHPKFSFVEDYFTWSGNYYNHEATQPINGKNRRVVSLSPHAYSQTPGRKVVKILTYMTLIVPIIMLFAKIISRALHPLIDASKLPNQGQNGNVNHDPDAKTNIEDLNNIAQVLDLSANEKTAIQSLIRQVNQNATIDDEKIEEIKSYLRNIVEHFYASDFQPDLQKSILRNISRPQANKNNLLAQVRREYFRLLEESQNAAVVDNAIGVDPLDDNLGNQPDAHEADILSGTDSFEDDDDDFDPSLFADIDGTPTRPTGTPQRAAEPLQEGRMLNPTNLGLKPADLPVPNPRPDTDVQELLDLAESLGLKDNLMEGIRDLVRVAVNPYEETIRLINAYLRGIIDLFNTTEIQPDLKKEVFTNLGRDAGAGTCLPGRLTKIQKEYGRLLGVKFENINEIILREIADLKFEMLNVVANEMRLGPIMHPHFIAAAQIAWADRFGLDGNAGRRDEYAGYQMASVTEEVAEKFLECYTPQTIIEYVLGKLNANKDANGVAMHIEKYNDYIKLNMAADEFGKPDSLDELRQHALLGKYVEKVIAELPAGYADNLDEIYKGVVDEYIKDNFIEYADVNDIGLDAPLVLKAAGLEYILVKMGILIE